MLVPRDRIDEATARASSAAGHERAWACRRTKGSRRPGREPPQFEKVQRLIEHGIDEGARLVAGRSGPPEGLDDGYFVRPTVFTDVDPALTIAREEIFGPVLCIIAYDGDDDAVRIANDSPYGLAAYVQSADLAHARRVARRLRAGNVQINIRPWTAARPSAATSNRATAASGASSASTNISRSRASRAMARREGDGRRV